MASGDNEQPGTEPASAKVLQRRTLSLPSWLDGRTIAILAGLVSMAAMVQTSHSRLSDDIHRLRDEMYGMRTELRGEIAGLRHELTAKIDKLDERLRVVEIVVASIRTHLIGFDARPPHDEPHHETS